RGAVSRSGSLAEAVGQRPRQRAAPFFTRGRARRSAGLAGLDGRRALMRILLLAYEFPPSPSPQSLRWAYLCRELHRLGHDIDVLTIDLGGQSPGLPELPAGVRVHRTYPGHVRGVVAWRRRRRTQAHAAGGGENGATTSTVQSRSGWKHRVSAWLQRLGERVWFPDLRGEWHRHACARLDELLASRSPDVVVS